MNPPSMPLDNSNIFSVSFDIVNEGYIPLDDCGAVLGIGQILSGKENDQLDPNWIPSFKSGLSPFAWQHHNLGMDERFTISPSDAIDGANAADIAIIVSYRPWFLPFHLKKMFRFVTIKQRDGKLYWRSWPLNESLRTLFVQTGMNH